MNNTNGRLSPIHLTLMALLQIARCVFVYTEINIYLFDQEFKYY